MTSRSEVCRCVGDAFMPDCLVHQVRAVLGDDDFFKLVSGKEVEAKAPGPMGPVTVRLILSDIGWARMRQLLETAENEHG